jgi:hypothetical protein
VWCKTDRKPSEEHFLGSTSLNIIIKNLVFAVEVASAVMDDDLI